MPATTFHTTFRGALLAVLLSGLAAPGAKAAPDEELLGKSNGYPVGTRFNWFTSEAVRVGSFSHLDQILPAKTLLKSDAPLPLPRARSVPKIRYTFEGSERSIDDYLDRQRVTGLLIIKDGEIQVERYQYERTERDRLLSNSMAKTITSMALGIALKEGRIKSLDDRVRDYVPDLAGNLYGDSRIASLLRMSSGARFVEVYDGKDDSARFALRLTQAGTLKAIREFDTREHPEGEKFHYASIETQVLGLVVAAATGQHLADYVAARIWKPMGAEADATWIITPDGHARAPGHFNATLRDWGRLGVLLANDGERDGKAILNRDYLLEATDWHRQPEAFRPGQATPFYGYGFQTWLFPGEERRFALLGVMGQAIFVDPKRKLVMVHMAVAKSPRIGQESMGRELGALWRGVLAAYGG